MTWRGLAAMLSLFFLFWQPGSADPTATNAPAGKPAANASYDVWITGQPFIQDGMLLFRADKPVSGNRTGNVVLLGAPADSIYATLPILMRTAEKHLTVRLYGRLIKTSPLKGHEETSPTVEYIVWKIHTPSDPDVLPPGQALHFNDASPPSFTNAAGLPDNHYVVRPSSNTNSPAPNP